MDKTNQPIRPKSITAFRFFVIMLIVIYHLPAVFPFKPEGFGGVGVTFFLVLSGFVLPLRYSRFTTLRDSLQFLWNRAVRIYPIHLFIFLGFLLERIYFKKSIDLTAALLNISLLQSWFPSRDIYFSFNGVSWFLSTLLFCNVVFAFIMYKPNRLFYVALLLSLVSLSVSIIALDKESSLLHYLLGIFPPNRLFNFLCGMVTSLIFIRLYQPLKNRVGLVLGTLFEIIVLLFVLDRLLFGKISTFLFNSFNAVAPYCNKNIAAKLVGNYFLNTLLSILILFVFGLEKGWFSRLLTHRYFTFLGNISFAIYLSHKLWFNLLRHWRIVLINSFGEVFVGVSACIAVIPISFLLYKFIELPISRRFKIKPKST